MMANSLPPGSTIGILGGGQLGKMLAMAAAKLGLNAHIFCPQENAPAAQIVPRVSIADYNDREALAAFAGAIDVVTFEFENIPIAALDYLDGLIPVRPDARALAPTQDRLKERELLDLLRLPVAPYAPVGPDAPLDQAVASLGPPSPDRPLFLKRRHLGYDGKGQYKITTRAELSGAQAWLGDGQAILEHAIPFDFETSLIVARGLDGKRVFYDPARNRHSGGILRESVVPAGLSALEHARAVEIAGAIADALDHVGVLCVEMFLCRGAQPDLWVNEIAPRVHNSGHWTIEACAVSQFENHIRAIAGWPLGAPARHADARMVNLLGAEADAWETLLRDDPRRSLHLYGKEASGEQRKMGHYVTLSPITPDK